jgi:MtN3 and saliva related transmembrane protein
MSEATMIGIAASILTGTSLLPQIWKIVREKKPSDLSPVMLAVLFVGLGLWVYYGVLKQDLIIIIANAFPMLLCISVVMLNIKYRR